MGTIDRRTFLKVGALAAVSTVATAVIGAPQPHDQLLATPEGVTLNHFPSQKYLTTANFGLVDDNLFFFSGWPEKELEISNSLSQHLGPVIDHIATTNPDRAFVQSYLGPTAPPAWCPSEPLLRAGGEISVVAHSAGAASLAMALEKYPQLADKIKKIVLICPAIDLGFVLPSPFSDFITNVSGYPKARQCLEAYTPFSRRGALSLITADDDKLVNSAKTVLVFREGPNGENINFSKKETPCHGLTAAELIKLFS